MSNVVPLTTDGDGDGLCIGCELRYLAAAEQAIAEALEASYHDAHRASRGRLRDALEILDSLTGNLLSGVDDDDADDDDYDDDLRDA